MDQPLGAFDLTHGAVAVEADDENRRVLCETQVLIWPWVDQVKQPLVNTIVRPVDGGRARPAGRWVVADLASCLGGKMISLTIVTKWSPRRTFQPRCRRRCWPGGRYAVAPAAVAASIASIMSRRRSHHRRGGIVGRCSSTVFVFKYAPSISSVMTTLSSRYFSLRIAAARAASATV